MVRDARVFRKPARDTARLRAPAPAARQESGGIVRLADAGDASAPDVPTGASSIRLPPDVAAFRRHVSPSVLDDVLRRSREAGVGGDEVLIHRGLVTPEAATRHVADLLRLPVAQVTPEDVPAGWRARAALRTGALARSGEDGGPFFLLAVRGRAVRRLARALRNDPGLRDRVALVVPEQMEAAIAAAAAGEVADHAAFSLAREHPQASAANLTTPRLLAMLGSAVVLPLAAGLLLVPDVTILVVQALLSLVFLAWVALRLVACAYDAGADAPARVPERDLPVYTILVPLYREAAVVPRLVRSLRALDYPVEKLDIKLLVEEDDLATRAAITAHGLPPSFQMVVCPPEGPRTKPKALNAGLVFARGTYVAVFDAEDTPEPDQLRKALAAFTGGRGQVGCVQARLVIDNAADSWVSRHFAAEYAALFDVLLPALGAFGLPMLLGGTSNHFRRDVLEQVGAWDPFNVTEDADLGVRLARAGWRIRVIASATEEEAPITVAAWLRQRTRWLKGWAQTILVHGRTPGRLLEDLGVLPAIILALLTAGPFASALLHPVCLAILALDVWRGALARPPANVAEVMTSALAYTNLVVGYAGAVLAALVGLWRRGLLRHAYVQAMLPFYWLLLSYAAWRAIGQLVTRPHFWEKTEHGLGRRRAFGPGRSGHR